MGDVYHGAFLLLSIKVSFVSSVKKWSSQIYISVSHLLTLDDLSNLICPQEGVKSQCNARSALLVLANHKDLIPSYCTTRRQDRDFRHRLHNK